jgi:hypothetical protein
MRRTLVLSLLALTLGSGVALADRDHRRGSGPIVPGGWHERRADRADRRAERFQRRADRYDRRDAARYDRGLRGRFARPIAVRRPVYATNGYFQFDNGVRYRYSRPVVQRRYYDYRVRPQVIVEPYQPVSGYVWVAGQWQWNGYEWTWAAGYYAADPAYAPGYGPDYVPTSYGDDYDDDDYDDDRGDCDDDAHRGGGYPDGYIVPRAY